MAKRKMDNLPPYTYQTRPGHYHVHTQIDGVRYTLLHTTSLKKAESCSKNITKIMDSRQDKINRANQSAVKQLTKLKEVYKND